MDARRKKHAEYAGARPAARQEALHLCRAGRPLRYCRKSCLPAASFLARTRQGPCLHVCSDARLAATGHCPAYARTLRIILRRAPLDPVYVPQRCAQPALPPYGHRPAPVPVSLPPPPHRRRLKPGARRMPPPGPPFESALRRSPPPRRGHQGIGAPSRRPSSPGAPCAARLAAGRPAPPCMAPHPTRSQVGARNWGSRRRRSPLLRAWF